MASRRSAVSPNETPVTLTSRAASAAASAWLIGGMVRHAGLMVLLALVLAGIGGWGVARLPGAFIPNEDQGDVRDVLGARFIVHVGSVSFGLVA